MMPGPTLAMAISEDFPIQETPMPQPTSDKRRRTRASAACTNCHWRKIRCSAYRHGVPCTNCRVEGLPCILHSTKWRGPRQTAAEASLEDQVKGNFVPPPSKGPWDGVLDSSMINFCLPMLESTLNLSAESPSTDHPQGYIRPLPSHIVKDDAEYLQRKGALCLPSAELIDELLCYYLEFVHPILPVLELHDFLSRAKGGNGTPEGVSLLLMQAVIFSTTTFVDTDVITKLGFRNRMEARKAFFQKAKLLYDFDYEQDRITLIQSLLLMTVWYETPDDQKDCWHWLNVTIIHARTIGLNRCSGEIDIDVREQRLRKRLWWCCLVRDPVIAMGMKRHVLAPEHDVPMLTLDDFEFKELPTIGNLALDCSKQRDLAILFIEMTKLCIILRHVLQIQYSVIDRSPATGDRRTRSTSILLPNQVEPDAAKFKRCEDDLRLWYDELPAEAAYISTDSKKPSTTDRSLVIFRAFLNLLYLTALSTFHRPRSLASVETPLPDNLHPDDFQFRNNALISREKLRQAANGITRILRDLHQQRYSCYLPLTGITILLSAMTSHIADVRFGRDETERETAHTGYAQCMQVLGELRDRHWAAEFAVHFLEVAVRRSTLGGVKQRPVEGSTQTDDLAKSTPLASKNSELEEATAISSETQDSNAVPHSPDYVPFGFDPDPFLCLEDLEDIFGGLSPNWALQAPKTDNYIPPATEFDVMEPTMGGVGAETPPFRMVDFIVSSPPDDGMQGFSVQW